MVDVFAHLLVLDGGLVDVEPQAGDEAAEQQDGGGNFNRPRAPFGGLDGVGFYAHGAGSSIPSKISTP